MEKGDRTVVIDAGHDYHPNPADTARLKTQRIQQNLAQRIAKRATGCLA